MDAYPPELLLEGYQPGIREAANELRAIVRRAVPESIERVRVGWRAIGYDVPFGRRTRYFALVWPEPEHVHLAFEYGVWMADPDGLLHGDELKLRKVRFATFGPGDPIPAEALIPYVREAARISTLSREERLALALDRD